MLTFVARVAPVLAAASLVTLAGCAASPPPTAEDPADPADPADPVSSAEARDSAAVFLVGHSLVNHDMPAMLNSVALEAGRDHSYAVQIINGAPLLYNWENSHEAEGSDARVELPTGAYDTLIITEAVPLDGHLEWSSPVEYGGNFHAAALAGNPDTQSYLYETWHATDEPGWRERIDADVPKWESIADGINAAHEGRDMLIVPAGQALGRLVDAIAAGTVPDVASRDALFVDSIHLSPLGNYFVALVQYATVYRRSPVGLTGATTDRFGGSFPEVPADTAARLQEIAWQAVTSSPRSGVTAP